MGLNGPWARKKEPLQPSLAGNFLVPVRPFAYLIQVPEVLMLVAAKTVDLSDGHHLESDALTTLSI